jgi:hypothetical protein
MAGRIHRRPLQEAGKTAKLQQQEVPQLVTIGSQATWYPKSERWRIEVIHPSTMKAAFIRHEILIGVTDVDSHDPEVVAGLVQMHRMEIEELIVMAELKNWPDKLGVLPQGIEGAYQR